MQYIPGGVQHNPAFSHLSPLVFTKAEGACPDHLDGDRYIDSLQAGGPTVPGSNPPEIRREIFDLHETSDPSTGLFHERERGPESGTRPPDREFNSGARSSRRAADL